MERKYALDWLLYDKEQAFSNNKRIEEAIGEMLDPSGAHLKHWVQQMDAAKADEPVMVEINPIDIALPNNMTRHLCTFAEEELRV